MVLNEFFIPSALGAPVIVSVSEHETLEPSKSETTFSEPLKPPESEIIFSETSQDEINELDEINGINSMNEVDESIANAGNLNGNIVGGNVTDIEESSINNEVENDGNVRNGRNDGNVRNGRNDGNVRNGRRNDGNGSNGEKVVIVRESINPEVTESFSRAMSIIGSIAIILGLIFIFIGSKMQGFIKMLMVLVGIVGVIFGIAMVVSFI